MRTVIASMLFFLLAMSASAEVVRGVLVDRNTGQRLDSTTGVDVRVAVNGSWNDDAGTLSIEETDTFKYVTHASEVGDEVVVRIDHADAVAPIIETFKPRAANVTQFGGSNGTFSGGLPNVNATQLSGSSTAADNAEVVFSTDFAANYNTTADKWNSSLTHINGSALGSTGAANFRAFFDGNGYGNVICSTTVAGSPTSSDTVMMLQTPRPENDGGLVGCIAVLRSTSAGEDFGPAVSVHRIVSYNYDAAVGTITIDSSPSFDLAAGDQVTILEPTFLSGDRTNLAAILADTGTDGVVLANNAITHEKIAADAIGSSEVANGAIDEAALAADTITAAKLAADVKTELQAGLPLQSYFDALFDGAPTFAEAMDDHGYTEVRADKIDQLAPALLLSTTIEGTPSSQTTFVLDTGPSENGALNGSLVIITDDGDPAKKAVGLVKNYVGLTQTVTLVTEPGIFTISADDQVDVIATGASVPLWLGAP